MWATVVSSWALFLGIAFIMLGNGLQGSLLGVRAELEGFPTAVTGLVMTGYFVGFLAGSTVVPRLVTRVGHIRVFAALASLASVAVLLHSVFVDPVSWTAMRLVTGFSYAGLYVVAESWLNDRATNETRGQLLSIYMVVMLCGAGSGQFLLNVADPVGFELFLLASVLVSLALIPILLTVSPAPEFDAPSPVGLRALYRISPLGVLGTLGTGMAQGGLIGMGAVYAMSSGLSIAEVSLFMAATLFGGMLFQWPIGRLSDRFDRRRVLTAVTILAALWAFMATAVTGPLAPLFPAWSLFLLAGLFGGMNMPMYSLTIAHTNDFLEPKQMVAASGTLVLVGGIGAVLGPMTLAGAMSFMGPSGFFWGLGVVHAVIGAFALYRMTVRQARPLEDQGAYVPVPPPASPVAAVLASEDEEHAEPGNGPEPGPAAGKSG
ncbi:MAG: MFS transporter [Kiloniellales bacterium]